MFENVAQFSYKASSAFSFQNVPILLFHTQKLKNPIKSYYDIMIVS